MFFSDKTLDYVKIYLISLQWYPETWTVGGKNVKYRPNLTGIGERQYKSGDPLVAKSHVEALDYGRADISIVSCKFMNQAYCNEILMSNLYVKLIGL